MSLRPSLSDHGPFRLLGAGRVVGGLLALAALCAAGCTRAPGHGGGGFDLSVPPYSDEAFGAVGEFELVERSGRTVTLDDLRGRVWVCDFFFARCAGPCPLMGANMRELQDLLEGTEVQLVSFSVEPEHDTPEILAEYADRLDADPERWWFLTGDKDVIYKTLCRDSFSLSVEEASEKDWVLGRQIAHATDFIVVDEEGRVRGYYEGGGTEGSVPELDLAAARARALERQRLGLGRPVSRLPAVNASLNGLAAVLLGLGYAAIRRGRREGHKRLMQAATVVSAAFLACYLYYHFVVTAEVGPTRFTGSGWTRPAYLALLLSHTLLAVVNLPMVLRTLWLAHKERWDAHRRLARWTFPIWMYVSVTGVLVYLALYHWDPA